MRILSFLGFSAFSRAILFFALVGGAIGGIGDVGVADGAPRFHVLRIAPEGATPPPEFAFPDLEGRVRKLSEQKGNVVLLAFFATWCPLCNEEMPKLARLHEKLKGRGFTVLAVSIDRVGAGLVRKWSEGKHLTYPILHDQSFSSRLTHKVHYVPTIYLLDRELRLAAWAVGNVDWSGGEAAALIERLLSAPRAESPAAADSRTARAQ